MFNTDHSAHRRLQRFGQNVILSAFRRVSSSTSYLRLLSVLTFHDRSISFVNFKNVLFIPLFPDDGQVNLSENVEFLRDSQFEKQSTCSRKSDHTSIFERSSLEKGEYGRAQHAARCTTLLFASLPTIPALFWQRFQVPCQAVDGKFKRENHQISPFSTLGSRFIFPGLVFCSHANRKMSYLKILAWVFRFVVIVLALSHLAFSATGNFSELESWLGDIFKNDSAPGDGHEPSSTPETTSSVPPKDEGSRSKTGAYIFGGLSAGFLIILILYSNIKPRYERWKRWNSRRASQAQNGAEAGQQLIEQTEQPAAGMVSLRGILNFV